MKGESPPPTDCWGEYDRTMVERKRPLTAGTRAADMGGQNANVLI